MSEVEGRIEELVARLDLEAKVRLCSGSSFWTTWHEPTAGLRSLSLSDGPAGVRGDAWDERVTSANLPSPTCMAASWDEDLVERLGRFLAGQARAKRVDVLLGPTVNLHRSPLAGRHFECFSEDPLLTARIGAAYVRGVQGEGVAATPKHYVANDSETERFTLDTRVDGVVVSDWHAARSTEAAGRAALDLIMPGPDGPWGDRLVAAVRAGDVPESAVDDKVRRILRLAARVGALEGVAAEGQRAEEKPGELLRWAAAAGAVLVRNQGGLLPLDQGGLRRVAVVGAGAVRPRTQGGGSATVYPATMVSPVDGLRAALGPGVGVVHGWGARVRRGLEPVTADQVRDPGGGEPGLAVRFLDEHGNVLHREHRLAGRLLWMGQEVLRRTATIEVAGRLRARVGGEHRVGVAGIGRFRLTAGDAVLVDEPIRPDTDDAAGLLAAPQRAGRLMLAEGDEVELTVVHRLEPGANAASVTLGVEEPSPPEGAELAEAVALAAGADVAVVVVGTTEEIESEGYDRASLALPGRQDDLVRAVAAANPRDVPVLDTRPVEGQLDYREGIHAGYRAWAGTESAFPFGHGLGYTTWAYEDLEAPAGVDAGGAAVVTVRLANRGPRPSREVVQAYLSRPGSAVERPALWMAGFAVVQAEPGPFQLSVGRSIADHPLTAEIAVR